MINTFVFVSTDVLLFHSIPSDMSILVIVTLVLQITTTSVLLADNCSDRRIERWIVTLCRE